MVAATLSPRASSCSVSSRPRPEEVPVINQVLFIAVFQSRMEAARGG
jgi:hypothetical protein